MLLYEFLLDTHCFSRIKLKTHMRSPLYKANTRYIEPKKNINLRLPSVNILLEAGQYILVSTQYKGYNFIMYTLLYGLYTLDMPHKFKFILFEVVFNMLQHLR